MAARRNYPRVRARLADGCTIAVVGREAQTLILLAEKKECGLRAYDFPGGPPFRLAAYVCDLRNQFGVGISTTREKHATGEHAVYTLTAPVEIVAVDHGVKAGAAA
ncbi:conserved hypothetical protein [Hyphomicrobiales bacterium]|nr:conserved hypothetical protein [Hyphomicrobiales bacterium]CAH1697245.1 conserved hypothetical protein [Hyphomicrobiales bacterium]CAI0342813.1 conserved hypothetical protein [Hyphomicrobiales bacterium]